MKTADNRIAIEDNTDRVRITVKTGDISLVRWPLVVFITAVIALAWGWQTVLAVDGSSGATRTLLGIGLSIGGLVIGLGALVQILSILIFYLFQSRTRTVEVSASGLSNGGIAIPIEDITSLFIGNKLGERIDRQPGEIHINANATSTLVGIGRQFGMALENKMADRAFSINVNCRGSEKSIMKSLTATQAEYLIGEIKKAISRFK